VLINGQYAKVRGLGTRLARIPSSTTTNHRARIKPKKVVCDGTRVDAWAGKHTLTFQSGRVEWVTYLRKIQKKSQNIEGESDRPFSHELVKMELEIFVFLIGGREDVNGHN